MLLCLLANAASGAAQPAPAPLGMPEDSSAEYERSVRDALQEYRLTNFSEAYALFEHAHQLQPSARTWRCLGMTSFELRQYVRAQDELRAALGDTRRPLTAEQRTEVTSLLARISRYIASIEVRPIPDSASVSLDGQPLSGQAEVNLGEHELAVRAHGYQPHLRRLLVEGGKPLLLEIELEPLASDDAAQRALEPAAAAPMVLTPSSTPEPGPAPREPLITERWWFWTAIGVVAAGTVAAVVVLTSEPEPHAPEPGSVGGVIAALGGRW